MRLTACSIASALTGRFSSALIMPCASLRSSKGSRLPSLLITRGISSSAVSKVVKRSPQLRHSRRRRICPPSAASRESVTLVSTWPQKGQCIACPGQGSIRVHREPATQLDHLRPYPLDRAVGAAGVENVRDPAGHLADLGLAKAASSGRRRTEPQAARNGRRARIV